MSPELANALRIWLEAATGLEHPDWVMDYGLCYAANTHGGVKACNELTQILAAEFGDFMYPFNDTEICNYWDASQKRIHHLNPQRLAWVRQKLGIEG